jgi:hypothetical protein
MSDVVFPALSKSVEKYLGKGGKTFYVPMHLVSRLVYDHLEQAEHGTDDKRRTVPNS